MWVLVLAGCLSLLLTAGGSGSTGPLLIAVEGPQSGEQAANGLDQLRGVRLAVRQLNARGGLWDGRKVAIFQADDKGDAANARGVARQVIAKGIGFVIGPYNSSVGISNLPLYRRSHVLPLWMTSRDETAGAGATVQPMNTQISPIEERYVKDVGARHVAMLVDDTANGAFTKGMADRLRVALERDGASVTRTSVHETTDPSSTSTYYAEQVAHALASKPDLVYVSTYFPEGVQIAKALAASGTSPRCLMGLANVDNGFVAKTTLAEAQRCVFSGVPAANGDAVRQDVRASVPGDVPQDAWCLGLVHLRFSPDPLCGDRPGEGLRLRGGRASAPGHEGVPRRNRHDHDRHEVRLPHERSRRHPSRHQPKEVRDRDVSAITARKAAGAASYQEDGATTVALDRGVSRDGRGAETQR